MKLYRKIMVLVIVGLFFGAGVISSVSGNNCEIIDNSRLTANYDIGEETITDPIGDVAHWVYSGDSWHWEYDVNDKPNIDITEISYMMNEDNISLILKVSGNIQDSKLHHYFVILITSNASYFMGWEEGEGIGGAITNGIFFFANPEISGDTLSCTFRVLDDDYSNVEFYGYSAEYAELVNVTSEFWVDYAPDSPNPWTPEKPHMPSGTASGKSKIKYTYTTYTIDPNKDPIYYLFDWGDGTNSGWIGPYNSGELASASHLWNKGNYSIVVKARDIYGHESKWSDPLPITMPKNKPYSNKTLLRFLEDHPHRFPLLRQLFGL